MARDVLHAWNAAHAVSDKRVLLPLSAEESAGGPCDMLVAFLHAAPGHTAQTGTLDGEIDSYLEKNRPVFIFFSEARAAFAPAGDRVEGSLEQFKTRYGARAVVDSFNDEKEFRAKFAQQLEATIRTHASFSLGSDKGPASPLIEPDRPKPAPTGVSELAQKLLIEACEDPEAYIGRVKDGNVVKIQANGQQLVKPGDPAAAAQWDAAFNELLNGGLIRDAGCHGRLFQISAAGFEYLLKAHGKAPIGYIAELGSV